MQVAGSYKQRLGKGGFHLEGASCLKYSGKVVRRGEIAQP